MDFLVDNGKEFNNIKDGILSCKLSDLNDFRKVIKKLHEEVRETYKVFIEDRELVEESTTLRREGRALKQNMVDLVQCADIIKRRIKSAVILGKFPDIAEKLKEGKVTIAERTALVDVEIAQETYIIESLSELQKTLGFSIKEL